MNRITLTLLAALVATSAGVIAAAEVETVKEEKILIALNTDDFVIEETDLSHLAVGDAETIVTDSGKTVDLLRTEDGIEVYVDGELIDTGGSHDEHHIAHRIKIICDEGQQDCVEDMSWIEGMEDIEVETLHDGRHRVVIMGGDGEDWDVEVLGDGEHEVHGTVHIVKEFSDVDPGELHEAHDREVIVIKKRSEDEI